MSNTLDVAASAGRQRGALQRARLARSAIICILGPALLYLIYLLLIAPAQFHSEGEFAVRGAQAGGGDALAALGFVSPTSNAADGQIVQNYIKSNAMVTALRERYGFDKAYDRFSLDPTARLSPDASLSRATRFWKNKVEVTTDPLTAGATVKVSAYTAEDAARLARGVLQLSEELVNSLPQRAINDLITEADRNVQTKRAAYDRAREALANYQGSQYSGVTAQTPAQQAIGLVGSIEGQLAQRRTALATMRETYQPGAPQIVGMEREIAALEAERDRAVARSARAPGETAAAEDIDAQSLLLQFQTAQTMYQDAVTSAESIRRQQVVDRKYIVSYVPPQQPSSSDWWVRLGNVIGVLIGSAILWGVGALIYSIIRDHME